MNITNLFPDANVQTIRLFLTLVHLILVSVGSINLLIILIILIKPYMRSITNVYIIGLCLADFMYLANLTLVATAQLNNKSWIFGRKMCTLYHGTETTGELFLHHNSNFEGKYASVIFVVLLAADRYCAMCRPTICARYRNYRIAVSSSVIAWVLAFSAAVPLYLYSEVMELHTHSTGRLKRPVCIAKWPSLTSARWYITFSSILIYVAPLALMTYFNYHILKKLQQALRNSKRMKRTSKSRAPYHRVTRLVLCVVIFHAACWSPFWLFNLLSSVFRFRIHTRFTRLVVNVIHLFPYINCALNPLLYAANAENFRQAFRSLFTSSSNKRGACLAAKRRSSQMIVTENFFTHIIDPYLVSLPFLHRFTARKRRFEWCNERDHSIITRPPMISSNKNELDKEQIELKKLLHSQEVSENSNFIGKENHSDAANDKLLELPL
uniref:G_PROTEIN_RECEP_F1_2 domain-containing protein n=1 Tax=Elaeophora elaphi TaxID=1147741 RepID=A0A0R3RLV8_9BILA